MKNFLKLDLAHDRSYGLDILRALAILFVLLAHGNFLLPDNISYYISFVVFDGVSIFFVLSGFLIGGILIRSFEKRPASFAALTEFWKRRWFRTLPPYLLVLGILTALQIAFKANPGRVEVLRYFTFTQNLAWPTPYWFFPESWSLSIEEWFYLLIPLSILVAATVFATSRPKMLVYVAGVIIILIPIFRFYRYSTVHVGDMGEWDSIFRKQVVTRLDSLMFGVIGAYCSCYQVSRWQRNKGVLFGLGILLLLINKFVAFRHDGIYLCVFSFSTVALGTLLLLPLLSQMRRGQGRVWAMVTYISLSSYSMYLINLSLVQGWILGNLDFGSLGALGVAIRYCLYFALTIILSIVIYKYFEIPTTKLRDWRLPKLKPGTSPSGTLGGA